MDQNSSSTSRGIAATGTAGAVVVVVVWLLSLIHVTMPPDVAASVGVILTGVAHWLMLKNSAKAPSPQKASAPAAPEEAAAK